MELAMEFKCIGCGKAPREIDEYVEAAEDEDMTPEQYVSAEEGTLNRENGHFACTTCYIKMGMPSSPRGWKAP
jgi:hypothetical protein